MSVYTVCGFLFSLSFLKARLMFKNLSGKNINVSNAPGGHPSDVAENIDVLSGQVLRRCRGLCSWLRGRKGGECSSYRCKAHALQLARVSFFGIKRRLWFRRMGAWFLGPSNFYSEESKPRSQRLLGERQ
ncbi:hypothetical protein CCP2SC5_150048 [Azospirillaceae bacterium]